jgi:hypothetical protein
MQNLHDFSLHVRTDLSWGAAAPADLMQRFEQVVLGPVNQRYE